MALARIDHRVIHRLAETRFSAIAGVTLIHLGDPDPSDAPDVFARLVAVDVDESPRVTNDDAQDDAEVVVSLLVGASEKATKADRGAVSRAVSKVLAAMTHRVESEGVHTLQLFRGTVTTAPYPFPSRRGRASAIIVNGTANRSSGTSLE